MLLHVPPSQSRSPEAPGTPAPGIALGRRRLERRLERWLERRLERQLERWLERR